MFDLFPTGLLVAFAVSLWTSLSSVALAATGAGLVLMIVRQRSRSASVRTPLLGLATGLGLFGLIWQGAAAEGARRMLARDHALALQAEHQRTEAAEAINRDLAARATQDLADAQADTLKLKDMLDALSHDPRGAHPAVPRDLARRLRNL